MKITGKAASTLCADCGHERLAHGDWLGSSLCFEPNCECEKFVTRPTTVFKKAK
jgi:hypothetical protein